LVVIDEVQLQPALFPLLRSLIDAERRPGRFLLLGSAAPDLLRQGAESLAGRIRYHELGGLAWPEAENTLPMAEHWLRGGFPQAVLAPSPQAAADWLEALLATLAQRDLPQLGLPARPPLTLRLFQMLAHLHGELLNATALGGALGITSPTVTRYLDFLEAAYLIRRLPPYAANLGKRLVRSPKIYWRDSGLLHTLLGLASWHHLQGHPKVGASWEGYVLEQIALSFPGRYNLLFYRTASGTEADVVLERAGRVVALVECKRTDTPRITRGLGQAIQDLSPEVAFVVAPIAKPAPLAANVWAVPLPDLLARLAEF
jgi:predicted AAA+ superfamily ATPase